MNRDNFQLPKWPHFHWNEGFLSAPLANVRYRQGRLLGGLEALGFSLQEEAGLATLTLDVLKSSEIDGEELNAD